MNAICDACRPAVEAMWHTMLARDPLCLCVRVCLHGNSPPPLVHVGSSFHSMFGCLLASSDRESLALVRGVFFGRDVRSISSLQSGKPVWPQPNCPSAGHGLHSWPGYIHGHVNYLSSQTQRGKEISCFYSARGARSMASQSSSQACHRVAERFAKDVYVHTVASSISNELFSSFFGHYHYSLGIPSERFHFVLHLHAQRDDDAAIRVLSKHNISWMSIRGHFDPSIRNGLVNSWVRTLPRSAYIINSDVDEH